MNNKETPDTEPGVTRSFWLQGRVGQSWQNLENIADSQAAILRLGDLVSEDRFDELKLLESRFSPATGETDYHHVVTIRDKQVIEQSETEESAQPDSDESMIVPDNQMLPPDSSEKPEQDQPAFWKIDPALSTEDASTAKEEPFLRRPSQETAAVSHHENQTESANELKRSAAVSESLLDHLGDQSKRSDIGTQSPERHSRRRPHGKSLNRALLFGGTLAGAFAVGLLIAAMNPNSASSIIAAVVNDEKHALAPDMLTAATIGDPQQLRQALNTGADPNHRNEENVPVLLVAARSGSLMSVDLLLKAGADPASLIDDNLSVLHAMAEEGLTEPLRMALATGVNPDLPGGSLGCLTPLGLAATNGHLGPALVLDVYQASIQPLPGCDIGPIELASDFPAVKSRLQAIADAEAPVLAGETVVQETTINPVAPLPVSLDVPETQNDRPTPIPVAVSIPTTETSFAFEPAVPVIGRTIEPATALIPEPVELASLIPQSSLEDVALTSAASSTDAPRAPNRPTSIEKTLNASTVDSISAEIRFDTELARILRDEGVHELETLLNNRNASIDLASLEIPVSINESLTYQNPIDFAVLSGKLGHAQVLLNAGGAADDQLLHTIVDRQEDGQYHPALHFLLKNKANTNSLVNGMTPLMRAAKNSDDRTTTLLLAYGANPKVTTDGGVKASDFAARSNAIDVQEKLVIAETDGAYTPLMFGLSWYDTLDDVEPQAEACKTVSDGFVACKLSVASWLDDSSAVIAQFDTHNNDRLVALQIDSKLYSNELEARRMFEQAVQKIDSLVPAGQTSFTVQELAKGMPFFESLKPGVNASNFYHYWPDEERAKPVYLHLKMIGHTTRKGFHRLILGNPFRIG